MQNFTPARQQTYEPNAPDDLRAPQRSFQQGTLRTRGCPIRYRAGIPEYHKSPTSNSIYPRATVTRSTPICFSAMQSDRQKKFSGVTPDLILSELMTKRFTGDAVGGYGGSLWTCASHANILRNMSKMIQLRNVPDSLHRQLKAR